MAAWIVAAQAFPSKFKWVIKYFLLGKYACKNLGLLETCVSDECNLISAKIQMSKFLLGATWDQAREVESDQ